MLDNCLIEWSVCVTHLAAITCWQVIRARVPLVAFVEAQSGIAVDISVSNHAGTFKSIFTRELSQFDARFVTLFRLVSRLQPQHLLAGVSIRQCRLYCIMPQICCCSAEPGQPQMLSHGIMYCMSTCRASALICDMLYLSDMRELHT